MNSLSNHPFPPSFPPSLLPPSPDDECKINGSDMKSLSNHSLPPSLPPSLDDECKINGSDMKLHGRLQKDLTTHPRFFVGKKMQVGREGGREGGGSKAAR
jgi:hypothetical protein